MRFKDALLQYHFEEMTHAVSVHLGCRHHATSYKEIQRRVNVLLNYARSVELPAEESGDVLISYFAYSEGIPAFFADLFDMQELSREFKDIPAWDVINMDLMPEKIPENQINFFTLSDAEIAALAIYAAQMRPLPVSWKPKEFDRVLNANVVEERASATCEAVVSRCLCESGFPYRSTSGQSSLEMKNFSLSAWDEFHQEELAEFIGDVYSWISCYKALQMYHRKLGMM